MRGIFDNRYASKPKKGDRFTAFVTIFFGLYVLAAVVSLVAG